MLSQPLEAKIEILIEFSMGSYLFRKLSLIIFSMFVLMVTATLSIAIPAQRRTCQSVSGLSGLLERGNILLFGELHGTQQAPAFIADVVCITAKKRIPITLGLNT